VAEVFQRGEGLNEEALPVWMQTGEMKQAMSTLRAFSEKERAYHTYQARQNYLRIQRSNQRHLKEMQSEMERARSAREEALVDKEQALAAKEHERAAKEQALLDKEKEQVAKEDALVEIERLKRLLGDRGAS
jgi:hypothetical protein